MKIKKVKTNRTRVRCVKIRERQGKIVINSFIRLCGGTIITKPAR